MKMATRQRGSLAPEAHHFLQGARAGICLDAGQNADTMLSGMQHAALLACRHATPLQEPGGSRNCLPDIHLCPSYTRMLASTLAPPPNPPNQPSPRTHLPSSTYEPSGCRRMLAVMLVASEDATAGSVMAKQLRQSPRSSGSSQRRCCAREP